MSTSEPTVGSSDFVWQDFVKWLQSNLREGIDINDLPLQEIRRDYSDLVSSEARKMATKDERIAPSLQVEEAEENPLLAAFLEDIRGARGVGATDRQIIDALRRSGLELERPTSAGLGKAKKEIQALKHQVESLMAELMKPKERAPPPPPTSEQLMTEELTTYIRSRLIQGNLPPEELMFLSTFIDFRRTLEENRRRIDDQIQALKILARPPPTPVIAPKPRPEERKSYFLEEILGGVAYPPVVKLRITLQDGGVEESGNLALSTGIRYAKEYAKKGWRVEFFPV